MNPLLRRLAEHTDVRPGTMERLRARFVPPSTAPALRALGDIDENATIDRLRAGRRPATSLRFPRFVSGGLLVLGAAGASTILWRTELLTGSADRVALDDHRSVDAPASVGADLPARVERREPARPVLPDVPPDPEKRRSVKVGQSEAAPRSNALPSEQGEPPQDLALTLNADNSVESSEVDTIVSPAPVVQGTVTTRAWEVGTFEGSVVAPDVLIVTTREASIRVTDGAVTVHRDRRGTSVHAAGGTAQVRCGSLKERPVPPEGTFCLPVSAAGWLGRGQALRDAGAPNAEVLAAADAGLTFGADDPAFGELIVLRVMCLRAAGRHADARAAARMYPADGPRAAELEY